MRRCLEFHRPRPGNRLTRRPALFAALICVSAAHAEEHVVATRGNQWSPSVAFIEVGDSVVWTGMTSHETALIDGLHPTGVMSWGSELNQEGFRVTFDQPGAYIYKCHVHLGAGMLGAIVVGPIVPANLEALEAAVATLEHERVFAQRVVGRLKREIERRQRAQR